MHVLVVGGDGGVRMYVVIVLVVDNMCTRVRICGDWGCYACACAFACACACVCVHVRVRVLGGQP